MCGCDRKKCAQCVGQQTAFFVLPATEQLINPVSPVCHLSVAGLSFFQADFTDKSYLPSHTAASTVDHCNLVAHFYGDFCQKLG